MTDQRLLVLVPIYEDWEPASMLLRSLDTELAQEGLRGRVLLVDDGSKTPYQSKLDGLVLERGAIERIDVLRLRRNLGHQRAIAVGLCHVAESVDANTIIVMDGDGQDAPRDVPRLVAAAREHRGEGVVFAERRRRSESLVFRFLYHSYRLVHRLLTGIPVRIGNFSVIPRGCLASLILMPELWNHYAAAVQRSGMEYWLLPTERAQRLAGRSQMNFVALVTHGFSALFVHRDLIGARLLVTAAVATTLCLVLLGATVVVRWRTDMAVPGWSSIMGGIAVLAVLQLLIGAGFLAIVVLGSRSNPAFIPVRDYGIFIENVTTVSLAR